MADNKKWAGHLNLFRITRVYALLIQSTLVISKSKGTLSEILPGIRTARYQICRFEEQINRTNTFNK